MEVLAEVTPMVVVVDQSIGTVVSMTQSKQ